jgi:hypothetical protein
MFEGLRQKLRAVQYGDLATRRRWFLISVISFFCVVVAVWVAYVVWRGSFMAGWEGSIQSVRAAWETITGQMRDAFK